jgi:hypothetical protein
MFFAALSDQMIIANPPSRGTETSAEVLEVSKVSKYLLIA